MTGHDDYIPLMADSERAMGRLDRALALVHEANPEGLSRAMQIELHIVESGIRRDQGLADAAVLALQVPELTSGRRRPWSARLFYAYADALLAAGRERDARDAFARAAEADTGGETDAAERLDELDGLEFEDLAESGDLEDEEDLDDAELAELAELEGLEGDEGLAEPMGSRTRIPMIMRTMSRLSYDQRCQPVPPGSVLSSQCMIPPTFEAAPPTRSNFLAIAGSASG